ncbi:hypothetical protein AHAS_Ahas19G0201900 [Arachis hypogaea]
MVKQNFMGYHPPSPISNGGWEYHQETSNSGHSNSWSYASEPQDEKENYMGYFPPSQNDASHDSNGGWGEQNQKTFENPYFTYQEPSSLERTSNSLMQNCPTSPSSFSSENFSSLDFGSTQNSCQSLPPTQISMNQGLSKLEIMFEKYEREAQKSWKRQEALSKNMNGDLEKIRRSLEPLSKKNEGQLMDMSEEVEKQDEEATASSELSMKNEVVKNETTLEMTKEHEESQLSQISLTQKLSTIESVIEKYKEEIKKCWEDQQTSSMKKLLSQMLGAREEVEEQESEEVIPENSHSSEAENHMKEGLMEPPIQETLDEKKTPTITQPPRLGFKEVKAINKSTKKRIVTKLPRTTFKRRSTTSNPTPGPIASKLNQAMYNRKLAERKPRQGAIAESSPLLKSFLLTNWKKRKKVNNMSTVGIISLLCFVFVLCFV